MAKTKAEIYARQQEWRKKNRAHVNALGKLWELNNREKKLKSSRESYHRHKHKNRDQRLKNASDWYYKNKDRILPEKKARYRKEVSELRFKLFEGYGAICRCCGETDSRFLTLDHKYCGRGNAAPILDRHIIQTYKRIIAEKFPSEYQILCANCNWAKGVFGECFHQQDRVLVFGKNPIT